MVHPFSCKGRGSITIFLQIGNSKDVEDMVPIRAFVGYLTIMTLILEINQL